MGLGKTMQCAAFLAGLFHSRLIRCRPARSANRLAVCAETSKAHPNSHIILLDHILIGQGLIAGPWRAGARWWWRPRRCWRTGRPSCAAVAWSAWSLNFMAALCGTGARPSVLKKQGTCVCI